jgi:tetratricopeptide (TPR) repeat protein
VSQPSRNLNWLFATVLALLGSCVVAFLYTSSGRTAIAPAARNASGAASQGLPDNHPPVDSAREIMVLEELSRKAPENADYKTRIGNLYYDLGRYDKAIEAYQQSLALNPRDANVETDMATCLHQLGQHDRALETLDRVLAYRPGFTQAMLNKGVVLFAGKNDRAGAIGVWEELLRANPELPQRAELEARIKQLKTPSP